MEAVDQEDGNFLCRDLKLFEDIACSGDLLRRDLSDFAPPLAQSGKKAYFDHEITSLEIQKGRGEKPLPYC